MLRAGIVGLPNVGKSTLFNAMTKTRKAQAANYPFCTIEPNVGVVEVPDSRLEVLGRMSKSQRLIPAAMEMVDIAGLVRGASQGEGLGNQFLAYIREVDAIVQVVRCFEDENIHHVAGQIDPVGDIETIMTELVLADLAAVQKRIERVQKGARSGDRVAKAELDLAQKLVPHLDAGRTALTADLDPEERALIKGFFLLTYKPTLFACNVREDDLPLLSEGRRDSLAGRRVAAVEDYCRSHLSAESVVISAQIESELIDLPEEDQRAYLADLGVTESGVGALIRAAYHLLGLRTFLTTGEKETRAWTIRAGDTAPKAAGVIHSDFERGFIAAETVSFEDLVRVGSLAKAREAGLLRLEGKEYVVKDGDVMEFRFNV